MITVVADCEGLVDGIVDDVEGAWLIGDAPVDVLFGAGDATRSNVVPSTPALSGGSFFSLSPDDSIVICGGLCGLHDVNDVSENTRRCSFCVCVGLGGESVAGLLDGPARSGMRG